MQGIIIKILEMCGYDKSYIRKVANTLLDLCGRTNDNLEEE